MGGFTQRNKSAPVQRRGPPSTTNNARAPVQLMGYDAGRKAMSPTTGDAGDSVQFDRGAQLADPELARDDKTHERETHEYKRAEGKLFKWGVRAQDVMQGWLSDCYFAAALAAVAQRDPGAIQQGVKDLGNDVFSVRFFNFDRAGNASAQWVDVDADFPFYKDKNTWAYMQSTQKGELWPALVEKAYAVFKAGGSGDYDTIGQGGFESDVLEALTGRWCEDQGLAEGPDDAIWRRLKRASDNGQAMTAGTYSPKEGEDDPRYGDKTKIWENHAYTVMGVFERGRGRDKQRMVRLRNPWGESEPDGNGKNDGVFAITLAEFREKYESVTILDA